MTKYILLAIILLMSYVLWMEIPVNRPPGVLAKYKPVISTSNVPNEIEGGSDFKMIPLAKLSGEVRVIEKDRYFFDSMSSFSPLDVLIGWNELSDQRNLEFIRFSLGNRNWEHKLRNLPLPINNINEQVALWHLIPSTPTIKKNILSIRNGHLIKIEGILVNIIDKEGLKWETSTSLDDRQFPKHEIVWVTSLTVK